MTDFPHISHVEKLLHVTEFPHINHVEKFSTLQHVVGRISPHDHFFSTDAVCGVCDKYQVKIGFHGGGYLFGSISLRMTTIILQTRW